VKYLLDTNIVSELMKPVPDPSVVDWVNEHDANSMLCAVVLAELASGIEALDDGKRKAALYREIRFIQEDYRERMLPFDESAAWEWARYVRLARDAGFSPPLLDSQIAATARAWGLTVVTRNESDFPLMQVVNPFGA
jgi:toxin FitB